MVSDERDTTAWFAIRMGPRTFGIFDAFADERGREAHLQGKLAMQIRSRRRNCSSRPRKSSEWKSSRTSCLTSSERRAPELGRAARMSAAGASAALPILEGQKPSSKSQELYRNFSPAVLGSRAMRRTQVRFHPPLNPAKDDGDGDC